MPRYFTGKAVNDKTLTQTEAATFKALVERMIGMPMLLTATRAQYHAMTPAEQNKAKQVGYVTACTFPQSPWEGRTLAHATECNLLFLDIDAKDGATPARPYVESPGVLNEKLPFNFAAYKTISSTPENPRLRIMVDARGIPVDRYADAVRTVAWHIGLPFVTSESVIATQPMYRPSVFADQDPDLEHPLIATKFDAATFTVADIAADPALLPDTVSSTGQRSTQASRSSGDAAEDYLRFHQDAVPAVDVTVAREMLTFVSADCSRPEWIDIAAGLKHQFAADPESAYDLFDEWSQTGSKYVSRDDTRTNWDSLTVQPKGRAPVTIRTLIKRAAEKGWDGSKVKEATFQKVSNWIMFECKTSTSLMSEGPAQIAALPLLSHTEEGALLGSLIATLRQKFEISHVPMSNLRRDVEKCREMLVAKKEVKDVNIAPCWRGFVYVAATNEVFKQVTRQKYSMVALESKYSRELLPTMEDLQAREIKVTQASLHTPLYKPSHYLLNHVKCDTVDDYDYDPSEPQKTTYERDGKRLVNVYRRSYRAGDKALRNYAEDVFMDHMCNLIAEPEYRRIIVDWMAYNVQNPGEKIRWAILIQGAEGCGKTFLTEALRQVLGADNLSVVNNGTIQKGWGEWMFGSQVVTIEEVRVAGHNRHDILNMLKEPITNRYITINERNRATRTARNVSNYLAYTNYHDALPLGEDGRRWCVFWSPMQKKEHVDALVRRDPNYFSRLHDMLDTHGPGLRYLLENWQISRSFRADGPAPRTTYLAEMVTDTGSELQSTLRDMIEDGDSPCVSAEVVATGSLAAALAVKDIRFEKNQLVRVLREGGYVKVDGRHSIGGLRQTLWARPEKLNGKNPLDLLHERFTLANTDEWL